MEYMENQGNVINEISIIRNLGKSSELEIDFQVTLLSGESVNVEVTTAIDTGEIKASLSGKFDRALQWDGIKDKRFRIFVRGEKVQFIDIAFDSDLGKLHKYQMLKEGVYPIPGL